MVNRKSRIVVMAAVLAAAATGAVLATPASGVLTSAIMARGAFQESVDIKIKVGDGRQEVVHVPDAQDTVMQQIVLAPNGHTGWHSHPGPVIVLVKSGALTLYEGEDPHCTPTTYQAGQAFVDSGQGHVHVARNLSTTENVELWATYLDVPHGGSPRIDQPDPGNCAF